MPNFKRALAARLRALAQRLDPEPPRAAGGFFVPPAFTGYPTTSSVTWSWLEKESRS